jgi:hypothetical protein
MGAGRGMGLIAFLANVKLVPSDGISNKNEISTATGVAHAVV